MTSLRPFVVAWLLITTFLALEYLILHDIVPLPSQLERLACLAFDHCRGLTTEPGKALSYSLGWTGFGILCLTNLYLVRKHVTSLRKVGNLQDWLNWHIFFGLLGPTIIVFHCDFKVGGLVAISFWSMVISAGSGVVGRYFYMQLLTDRRRLKAYIHAYEVQFRSFIKKNPEVPYEAFKSSMNRAFQMAGGIKADRLDETPAWAFLLRSVTGEIRMFFVLPETYFPASRSMRLRLKKWALLRKRLVSIDFFRQMFGYWKTFHMPFAIFMYIVAVIHIVSSLIFRVT